jgi:tetratricopeptide (TPR) repeat protein
VVTKAQRILIIAGFNCLALLCRAQDSITLNDLKVIKDRSKTTVERYLNSLLNAISYTGAESTDIKDLITRSLEDSDRKIFLNRQITIADDISDPDYTNSSNAPEVPVIRYLNAFNTFYEKSDTNSVYFSDIRSSAVKKGRLNLYINVYFTSFFKNNCLSKPSVPYKPEKRVAEIFIKKGASNKWLLYISRIGFFNPADTVNDIADNIAIATAAMPAASQGKQTNSDGHVNTTTDPTVRFNQYIDQARLEEKKRNYQAAINLYSRAIDLDPGKKYLYDSRIKELNGYIRILTSLEEKYNAGYYKDAVKGYSELIKKNELTADNSNSDFYLGRAKCFDKMGQLTKSYNEQVENYNKALKDYAKSIDYDNDNLEAIRLRADLYARMNRNVEALTEYRIYLGKDSTNPAVYAAMANIHMRSGNPEQAVKDSDPVLSQANMDPVAKSNMNVKLGLSYAQKKIYVSAEDYFTHAIALDSNNALSYYHRGMTRIKMNRIQSAANDFILARRKGLPSYAPGISATDSSLEDYWKLVAFQPTEIYSVFGYVMGNIYLNTGKYDSAYSWLARSFQSDPSNAYIVYSMAICIYLRGNTEESLNWFERAFKTNALKRNFVDHDSLLGSLQDDKEFRDLKRKYLQ